MFPCTNKASENKTLLWCETFAEGNNAHWRFSLITYKYQKIMFFFQNRLFGSFKKQRDKNKTKKAINMERKNEEREDIISEPNQKRRKFCQIWTVFKITKTRGYTLRRWNFFGIGFVCCNVLVCIQSDYVLHLISVHWMNP